MERLDSAPPPGEPLLTALATHLLPRGVTGAALAGIEDGWAALLDGDPDAAAIRRHGRGRGAPLFAAAAKLLSRHAGLVPASTAGPDRAPNLEWIPEQVRGVDLAESAGVAWALADLGHRHSAPEVREEARTQARAAFAGMTKQRWPKPLRPLGALAALARRDSADASRRQGSPARLLRMLAHRVTGA